MRSSTIAFLLVLHRAAASFFSYEDEGEATPPPAPPAHDDSASSGTSLLVVGLVLAFLSQISMVGKGLQKEAVGGLPALALTKDVLTQYVTSLPWVRGVGVDVAGALLGLAALSILPISVAQPIFCNGIVLLSLFSYFYLKEALAALEWAAVGVCFGGTLVLACCTWPGWHRLVRTLALGWHWHRGCRRKRLAHLASPLFTRLANEASDLGRTRVQPPCVHRRASPCHALQRCSA